MADSPPADAAVAVSSLPEVTDPRQAKDQEALDTEIIIDGRRFAVTRMMTAQQEFTLMDILDRADMTRFITNPPDPTDPAMAQFGYLATLRAFRAGVLFDLLATLLVEEGTVWTVESGKQTATLFASLSDAESKQTLREVLVQALVGFFVRETVSDETSSSSSEAPKGEAAPK